MRWGFLQRDEYLNKPSMKIVIIQYQNIIKQKMEGEGRGAKRGGFGDRGARGGRGGARGGRDGPRPGGPRGDRGDKDAWTPLTKLGRLVKYNHIKSLEEIYTHSIPIKESQIVDELLSKTKRELSDEVMKIMSVQKQTKTDFLPSPFIRYADFLEQQPEKRGPRGDRPERGRGGRGGRGGFRGGDRPERTGDRPERTGDRPERGGERRGRGAPRGRGGPRREEGATPAGETAAE
ncbi:hypothetical protein FGO68_gene1982 [Halteria grandinella]|uniref:Uncharacterized protein n=1 Tax=Halteria grandinella TaxID=5974 RepID=A0A8J8NM06_HALGN|nr:hypothetical protein FGO68_gene1982 [Halteria grandinella]